MTNKCKIQQKQMQDHLEQGSRSTAVTISYENMIYI